MWPLYIKVLNFPTGIQGQTPNYIPDWVYHFKTEKFGPPKTKRFVKRPQGFKRRMF